MALAAGDVGGILTSISPVGLAGLAAAAVAAAAAYAFFHDDVSAATDALNAQRAANEGVAASHRTVTDAVYAHKSALDTLSGASISRQQAALDLERANLRVAETEKKGGRSSIEYRQALLDQRRAQDAVRSSRTDLIRQGEEAIRQTRQTRAEIDREVRSTQQAADAARKRQVGIRSGLIAGKDAAAASREIDRAMRAESRAVATSAAKHRDNAQRALEMADAIGSATPRAKALQDQLRRLARQELNLASAIAAMNALRGAASTAAAGVQNVYNLLRNPPAAPTIAAPRVAGGGGGGGRRGGGGGAAGAAGRFFAQELGARGAQATGGSLVNRFLRSVPTGSPTSLTRTTTRGDRRASEARIGAESKARKEGKSDDEIREAGERAYINARKATIKTLRRNITTRARKLVTKLKAKRKVRAGVKVPAKPPEAKQKALDRREKLKGEIDGILDELETLWTTDSELVAEASELGEDLKELNRSDAADGGDAPADGGGADAGGEAPSAPTEADYLDAAAAEAALTPGIDDDIAAAEAIATFRGHELNRARASQDPRAIAEAARAYQAAIDALNQLKATRDNTDAINANTDALKRSFGGSNVIGYRGQDWVLGSLAPPSSDRLVGVETGL